MLLLFPILMKIEDYNVPKPDNSHTGKHADMSGFASSSSQFHNKETIIIFKSNTIHINF